MKLNKILPYLLYTFKDDRELVRAIEEISLKFTQNRSQIGDYLKDERLVSAYTAFYLLTNIPKLEAIYPWLPKPWLNDLKNSQFIDVGAGPGTFSIAWRESTGTNGPGIVQIENSEIMKRQARKLWAGLYPNDALLERSSKDSKLLFFGHSANEMGAKAALKYIQDYSPEHILFVEPGTKEFFQTMMTIRDELIKMKYNIMYPCPNAGMCPLKESTQDWCHQFLQVKQDAEIERISQMAKKDRRNLPVTVHGYSIKNYDLSPETRIVRVLPETKFSFEWEVCHNNIQEKWQVMKRGLEKQQLTKLSEITSGAGVSGEVDKVLESGKRIKNISLF